MTSNQYSTEELRKAYEECGGDLTKLAGRLGISLDALTEQFAPYPPPRRRRPPADLGQPNLRKYIVSVRHSGNPQWPKEDEAKIEKARSDWEAGMVEMCQGRDRGWVIQYSIPRKKRCAPRKFFVLHE